MESVITHATGKAYHELIQCQSIKALIAAGTNRGRDALRIYNNLLAALLAKELRNNLRVPVYVIRHLPVTITVGGQNVADVPFAMAVVLFERFLPCDRSQPVGYQQIEGRAAYDKRDILVCLDSSARSSPNPITGSHINRLNYRAEKIGACMGAAVNFSSTADMYFCDNYKNLPGRGELSEPKVNCDAVSLIHA